MSLYGTLKAAKLGAAPDVLTTLRAQIAPFAKGGSTPTEKELEGVPPLTFRANGEPLIECLISGNMSQSGTPTSTTPITPSECGDLVNGNYVLPIKTGVTTNVNLNETQSTRKVYKWVLTGEEDWRELQSDSTKHYLTTITPDYLRANSQVTYVSSHYVAYEQTVSATLVPDGNLSLASSTTAQRLYIADSTYTTNDTWKAYLAAQYANGTPVTIWYVLATETTTTLNEPLRKIGDYADSVSVANIPTTAGNNTLDVDTELKPSSVYIKYKE